MTTTVAIVLAVAVFAAGLYLGHRWGSHDSRIDAAQLRRQSARILRFAAPYIEAHAEQAGWLVDRDVDGHIVDVHPLIRCGTPAVLAKELLEEQRRRKSLH
jgi:hypothetical protein